MQNFAISLAASFNTLVFSFKSIMSYDARCLNTTEDFKLNMLYEMSISSHNKSKNHLNCNKSIKNK